MKKLTLVTLVAITGLFSMTSCGNSGKSMTPQEAAFEREVQSAMRGGCSREDAIRVAKFKSKQRQEIINGFTDGIEGKTVILE